MTGGKPPKCKLCGTAHWGNEHVWSAAPKVTVESIQAVTVAAMAPKKKPLAIHKMLDDADRALAAYMAVAERPSKPRPKRDRAAYMRTYRAKQKVK